MNNFVFSQDPLLFQSYQPKNNNQENFEITQKQFNDMMQQQYRQYQQFQQQISQPQNVQEKDNIGELDLILKGLRKEVAESLYANDEYMSLNNELQGIIQEELMSSIRWKINSNKKAIENIERQKEIINKIKNSSEDEERKNLAELNDYMKNYSSMSFDEYKKIKTKKK